MRLFIHLLCFVLSVSFVLAPFSRLHAHVAGEQHVNVHGGHNHDAGGGHAQADAAHSHDGGPVHAHATGDTGMVVDLQPDLSQSGFQLSKSFSWMVAFVVVALATVKPQLAGLTLRTPRMRTRPPSPYPHALPLLRGPPASL